MGNPVSHSLSPAMHNAAFLDLGLNKVYLPFPVVDVAAAIQGVVGLGVHGVSVTIPHKQAVIPFLDNIDPIAEKIGAVNTLVINDGKITGLNTDWLGSNRAFEGLIGSLAGKSILILGAGGSAKAIGFGLLEAGATIMIASRTPATGKELARKLGCPWYPIAEADTITADGLINATSVGMTPNDQDSPISRQGLKNFPAVMDIVYAPLQTRLLKEAGEEGLKFCNGLDMLLMQGAAQFELWTNRPAPLEVMRAQIMTALG